MDMWIARLMATFPHTHSPAKSQPFFDFGFNVKTDRSDSNLDWNLLLADLADLAGFRPADAAAVAVNLPAGRYSRPLTSPRCGRGDRLIIGVP